MFPCSMGFSGGASGLTSQYACAKPGGAFTNMRLSWSGGSVAPSPLSATRRSGPPRSLATPPDRCRKEACARPLEVGIEPTVRHGMDLGYIPVIVSDACGYGNQAAAERSLAALAFAGGSLQSDRATVTAVLRKRPSTKDHQVTPRNIS